MKKISPSILSADFSRLGEELKRVEDAGADWIHIDVMDGHFVPNITVGPFILEAVRRVTSLPLDVHLMIENPEAYIDGFADAGADIITFHIEAAVHAHRLAEKIRSRGIKAGVALNPATHQNAIEYILNEVDMVLIMTVNPGFGGQKFIESMIPKIAAVSGRGADIQVDGGIGASNISKVTEAGTNIIVAGSSVFCSGDPAKAVRELREAAQKY